MSTPTYCASCGHELGIGRFCTNCGKPVAGRHPRAASAAEAPVTAPVVPPPVGEVPPAVRYPLYADATLGEPPSTLPPAAPPPPTSETPLWTPASPPPEYDDSDRRRSPSWLPWLAGLLLVALVAIVGGVLVAGSGGEAGDDPTARQSSGESADGDGSGRPDAKGTEGAVERPDPDDVIDISRRVSAEVPAVAPPSRDRQNRPVTFAAPNLLDGRVRTSWRMAGDGTGRTITFDLGDEVVLTEVAIINGYAKIDGADNWYRGNRRLRSVQWEFDDGSRITQELEEKRTLQTLGVGPVRTSTVRLHLVEVTPPGKGRSGRDFTAISEVRFLGAPS